MIPTDIMQDASEIIHYNKAGIPLYVKTCLLSSYPNMQAICHWHEDLEFIHIVSGKMNYYVNGKRIVLKENDCLMIHARQMHYGYSYRQQECRFTCVLFHPCLFTGHKTLYRKYIVPVLENRNLEYLYFDALENRNGLDLAELLVKIAYLKEQASPAYEMEIIGLMHIFWSRLLQHTEMIPFEKKDSSSDLDTQKDMVSYLYQHYGEKITLSQIAAAGNVCRSKCCAIFRHYLQQSPIDFLNAYRLKVSCNLLIQTTEPVTQIALTCGFQHLSYYSKLFLRAYGCTPREYRQKYSDFSSDTPGT